jgi:hypothetical protein
VVDKKERGIFIGPEGKMEGPKIKKIYVHPDYKDGFKDKKFDLGIIELETPLPHSGQLDFAPIPRNALVKVVGTGLQKERNWGFNDGKRRAGSNSISKVDKDGIWLKEITIPAELQPESSSYPKCIPAGGDSGSPLIVNTKIRGILTGGNGTWNKDGSTTSSERYVNISQPENRKFINMVLRLNTTQNFETKDCARLFFPPKAIQTKENELQKLEEFIRNH